MRVPVKSLGSVSLSKMLGPSERGLRGSLICDCGVFGSSPSVLAARALVGVDASRSNVLLDAPLFTVRFLGAASVASSSVFFSSLSAASRAAVFCDERRSKKPAEARRVSFFCC